MGKVDKITKAFFGVLNFYLLLMLKWDEKKKGPKKGKSQHNIYLTPFFSQRQGKDGKNPPK